MPVEVLAEVNTAVTVVETHGPAVTEALRQLDRATTVAWKAVHLAEVTDDEWQLVKHAMGIGRGWDAAYRLVSTLDLPGQDSPATVTLTARKRSLECSVRHGVRTPSVATTAGGVRLSGAA